MQMNFVDSDDQKRRSLFTMVTTKKRGRQKIEGQLV